jgi:hypothetical protein
MSKGSTGIFSICLSILQLLQDLTVNTGLTQDLQHFDSGVKCHLQITIKRQILKCYNSIKKSPWKEPFWRIQTLMFASVPV